MYLIAGPITRGKRSYDTDQDISAVPTDYGNSAEMIRSTDQLNMEDVSCAMRTHLSIIHWLLNSRSQSQRSASAPIEK